MKILPDVTQQPEPALLLGLMDFGPRVLDIRLGPARRIFCLYVFTRAGIVVCLCMHLLMYTYNRSVCVCVPMSVCRHVGTCRQRKSFV